MAALPDLTVLSGGDRYRVRLDLLRQGILDRHLAGEGVSYVAIAECCEVDRVTLYRLLRGPVSLATACKIAKGLGIDQAVIVFKVPDGDQREDGMLASEEVLEQVEASDPPATRLWMVGELTPFNRRLAPGLLVLALVALLGSSMLTWVNGGPKGGSYWFASLLVIFLAFFSIRVRWIVCAAGVLVGSRLLLYLGGRLPLEMALVECSVVLLYCAAIRLMGMYSRHAISQEAAVAVWANPRRIQDLRHEAEGWEWSNSRPGSS